MTVGRLRSVPLFSRLTDDDLARIAAQSTTVQLAKGRQLFAEGEPGDQAYVIVSGEIEIVKQTGGRDVVLSVRKANEVIGEMALLHEQTRNASARARRDAELIAIPKAEIDALMEVSAGAVRALFGVVLERLMATVAHVQQSERMVQLGTLTAGLAHELNNPAAAANRAAGHLRGAVTSLVETERRLFLGLDDERAGGIRARRDELVVGDDSATGLDPIARSDLETRAVELLEEAGVEDGWRLAPELVDAGVVDRLEAVIAETGTLTGDLLASVDAHRSVAGLLYEVEEGTRRMSAIVRALKSYSYLDQAPVQDVDVAAGIKDTLLILKHKLGDIEVRLELAPDLPPIEAYGSELNQVWTNLIDNAAYAIHETGRADGRITLRAHAADETVEVEVEDNGGGIPPEAHEQIFDPFFTSKPPGSGTGLGLNITYSIIVHHHRGDIRFETEPGRTVFRVTLPQRLED